MMFNPFIWELYRESTRGQKALTHCSNFSDALCNGAYSTLFFGLSFDEITSDYSEVDPIDTDFINTVRDFAAKTEVADLTQATALFEDLVASGLSFQFPDEAEPFIFNGEDLVTCIQGVSIGLHLAHPDFFIPYGFSTSFADLQRIGEIFNLALPPVPNKKDTSGRARYYAQLNQAFHEFRQSYGLNTIEMCAFLHDFAPRFLTETSSELPEPSKVWLITGGTRENGDFEWLEKAAGDKTSLNHWQGNLDTRRGDILLMYCVTPHSYIHSVWRAITDGFIDPFFHYHSTVWIGEPNQTVPVTFKEMKTDPLLSQKGAIKAHLQGPSGKPFTLEEYDAILSIMERKGQDISQLPRPPRVSFSFLTELLSERDVEVSLVEPLFERLGYTTKDWQRQLPLRMGRGERTYPDYVFRAKTPRGEESAEMVLETKFTISGDRALRDAYAQAVSYAYRLRAKIVLLAAREGLWTFPLKRGNFSLETFYTYTWDDLQHPDVLFALKKLLVKPLP